MTEETRLTALAPEQVGAQPCRRCREKPMKLPGLRGGLCIACYATERRETPRRTGGGYEVACFVGDPCLGCGSGRVDADGWQFWCDDCGMEVAVARPPR